MVTNPLPKIESIKFGWNTVTKKLGSFIALTALSLFISIIGNIIIGNFENNSPIFYFVLSIIMYIINIGLSLGYISIALDVTDGKEFRFTQLFSQFKIGEIFSLFLIQLVITIPPMIVSGIIIGVPMLFLTSTGVIEWTESNTIIFSLLFMLLIILLIIL